jgi:Cu2+-exporting ATPase
MAAPAHRAALKATTDNGFRLHVLSAGSQVPARKRDPWRHGQIAVSVPKPGRVVFQCANRFAAWRTPQCLEFVERSFGVPEVTEVEVDTVAGTAAIVFKANGNTREVLGKISRLYKGQAEPENPATFAPGLVRSLPKYLPCLRVFRYGNTLSTWENRLETRGWIRLRNSVVLNKRHLVALIERQLLGIIGIEHYKLHPRAGSISIVFNPRAIHPEQIVRHLDNVLAKAPTRPPNVKPDFDFPIASTSLGLAAVATFFSPPLVPISAVIMLYTAIPSFRHARRVIFQERRLGVDVLDSIIFTACLFTGEIFAGAMTAWFLSLGRKLLKSTRAESAKVLLEAVGRQPGMARVLRDGKELEVTLEEVRRDDSVVVHTGEVVPVDGQIIEGDAILDQHALTGESAPAEKTKGDRVFASTVMLAGKVVVRVERAGKETASSKISSVLSRTVAYKLRAQSRGEELADKAVIPALGLSALAAGLVGPSGALAVINSDLGTGIRMAAPLGMLTSLTLCAQHGILVKDGRALELMRNVDTVLFDKTGTLTREKPEVGRIICCGRFNEEQLLARAATAEQKFTHPIARAILDRYATFQRPMLTIDNSNYKVGYGITVEIEGEIIRVGSRRFMEMEKISIPSTLQRELDRMHDEGHSFVAIAAGDQLQGILELRSSHRPEAEEVVAGLRARGVNHLAIISGDHEAPTRSLAERLGMDRHFAEVLPQDKGRYVELLQKEGRTVCFVGDGINDSIALKKANVSISLRGASTLATDTAQIVFMEESLAKICALKDFSNGLESNVRRSWNLILGPNGFCIAGVFFLGFNIWHSVFFNNASAILALYNGLRPLRHAAKARAARERELQLTYGVPE